MLKFHFRCFRNTDIVSVSEVTVSDFISDKTYGNGNDFSVYRSFPTVFIPTWLYGPATIEVNGHGTEDPMDVLSAEDLMGVTRVEIPMGVALSLDYRVPSMHDPAHNAASVNVLSSRSTSTLLALGFTLFLSKLQVSTSRATLFLPMGVPFDDFCTRRVS